MNHLKFIATLLPVLACGYPSLTAADPAPVGAQASPAKPEITGCVVYSESDRSKKRDCLAQARASCAADPDQGNRGRDPGRVISLNEVSGAQAIA